MIRLAKIEDLKGIMIVIEDARNQLKDNGSLQWNLDDGYPDAISMMDDIILNKLFVYEENDIIKGCIAMCEYDEDYEQANITNNKPYVALHRMAVLKKELGKGIASSLIKHCITEAKDKDVFSDTAKENTSMNYLLKKLGFEHLKEITLNNKTTYNKREVYKYK